MTRTNTPDEEIEALNRRMHEPEDSRARRHEAQAEAATRRDIPPARLGAELAAEDRPRDESETADALKRAAANDRRV